MHSILLCSLILAILQLQNALTFGKITTAELTAAQREKSSSTQKVSTTNENAPAITTILDTRVRRSNNEDDFLINQLSREYDIMTSNLLDLPVTCNNLNDLESDTVIARDSIRSLFDPQCTQICRIEILSKIFDATRCNDMKVAFERDRRGKLDFPRDDLFVPVRGRRGSDMEQSSSPRISAEKKAKLDVLMNDLFVPNRGKRQLVRKHFLLLDPYPQGDKRSGTLELDMKDYFVPHRGKRQRNKIDELLSDNFFPQRGKKAPMTIIPKSHHSAIVEYDTSDPWLFQNINSDDRRMIDRLHDLNLGSNEVRQLLSLIYALTSLGHLIFMKG
ncbi:hypothetical protein PVAND_001381 [Polypedilum vanderplanki]|uniref:Uncharacterized protein n=1 Tax=Polypedilum vanderplanki TaxID=319348 RepID=A0A9J6BN17_POLVA|nr:hypothetical protein PVAND_001381 [Polypedilum vanderplanki]